MKKVLITATMQSHICQFHLPLIKMLKKQGFTVDVAAKNNLDVKPGLKLDIADNVYDIPFARSPFSSSNIKAYKMLKNIIDENHYDIIHCNTPVGGVATRLAASKWRKHGTKVIYTAHGFHFFDGAPKKNWLIYYPVEWFLSFKTDLLITINSDDYAIAQKHFHPKRLEYVRGVGFDEKRVKMPSVSAEEMRKELGIGDDGVMLFSIGELNKRKNHEVVLKALSLIKDVDIHYYIAGNGPLEGYLKQLTSELGLDKRVKFLGYTRQICEYMNAADIFMFPSLQEGLPLALMEAMECGMPVIASNIRGTRDMIKDNEGGYLLNRYDVEGFKNKILNLCKDKAKMETMSEINKKNAVQFRKSNVLKEMERLYCEIQDR